MAISYTPLWHLLLEKEMNKEDLKRESGITSNIIARISKGNYVKLESIEKICLALDSKVEDVVVIHKENWNNE
ncbi:helix-turn-helix transcriptional regulator [Mesomycoplasma ovipneumoniae]|uniref:Helix-turn-helix transcriptional regulator n=1 Tax=Mesomycoplasma ovipneumoniae TaxID=29562 RepID=A0AAJ2P569_9BACT|nr:helix-turn-helix transcriptional regulator [Mesomycoplasma ovipneumoniae]MDW2861308.1 helix-turn-helix transcriptional regulator [Mesomycoplasma ovipneumoniae]MDW2871153.1 helix-turn-helix transcriptional regulator [Mesomycoplasma ovipneumoniae]MDW2892653.1 helix-turn-helix transcriptional regulator [Mesomycoplasma ovipneumoniae]MDW2893509.1 helix-turn-helix transcriptional regulator [Mesomycoplasma ovipneumoniae]MDW2908816.1 helix-turn-helix transcriptional regulator [Mesomycoplasma ovipne